MKEARLIKVEGLIEVITPKNGKHFTLKECYDLIGCDTIEVLYIDNYIMILDEEGKLNNKPINTYATRLAANVIDIMDWVVGTVIYCPKSMFK